MMCEELKVHILDGKIHAFSCPKWRIRIKAEASY